MKVLKVKLRGFIGIQKGLGLDEIELDFTGLSGLVALEGANGMGKTTLLENLQPFRMLPSRTGTLKSHCYLKDSFKELTFEFNGQIYRTLIKIDAKTTRSDEGYIYLNGNEASEVDSKVSNYDAYIENLLGSPALFFSSIFCAQNSKKLSDLRPAELKALFAEFLRLDRYVKWEDTAKSAIRIITGAVEGHDKTAKATDTRIRLMGDPRNDLKGAKVFLADAERSIEEVTGDITTSEQTMAELKKEVAETAVKKQRIADHEALLEKLREEYRKAQQSHQEGGINRAMKMEELETEHKQKQEIIKDKVEIEKAVADKFALERRIQKITTDLQNIVILQQGLTKSKDEHVKLTQDLNKGIQELKADKELEEYQAEYKKAGDEVDRLTKALDSLENDPDIIKQKAKIVALEKSAAVLDDIDPGCTSQICGLITASLEDRDALPDARLELTMMYDQKEVRLNELLQEAVSLVETLSEKLTTKNEAITSLVSAKMIQISDLVSALNEIDEKTVVLNTKSSELSDEAAGHRDKLAKVTETADKLAQLVSAEDVAAALAKELQALKDEGEKVDKAFTVLTDEAKAQAKEYQAVIDSIEINEKANEQLSEADQKHEDLTRKLKTHEEVRARFKGEIPKYQAEIESLEVLELEYKTLLEKIVYCRDQMAEWEYLRVACSKDGMRALEIDAVAPVITRNANDLLSLTFGPNYSVRFETQDEDGKEVLSIIVIGGDGSETHLQYLSGGEKVWILKALRLAQTLISQEKSGRHFQSALMDEEDGALSADNAISFIKLYRSFQSTALMDLCFYITHRPEAVALADSIIRFKPREVTII
jgi:exonuclease SbcC